jgi:hypothetical protein
MANSLRDTIRAQASSGLIVWLTALAGWLLLYWRANNMGTLTGQLTMMLVMVGSELARCVHHVGGHDGGDDAPRAVMASRRSAATLNRTAAKRSRTVAFVAGCLSLWTFAAAARPRNGRHQGRAFCRR